VNEVARVTGWLLMLPHVAVKERTLMEFLEEAAGKRQSIRWFKSTGTVSGIAELWEGKRGAA
jgi:hypothetical protein